MNDYIITRVKNGWSVRVASTADKGFAPDIYVFTSPETLGDFIKSEAAEQERGVRQ